MSVVRPVVGAPPNEWWEPETDIVVDPIPLLTCKKCGRKNKQNNWVDQYAIDHSWSCPVLKAHMRETALMERDDSIAIVQRLRELNPQWETFFENPMTNDVYWARHHKGDTLTIKRTLPYERITHNHKTQTATAHSDDGSSIGPAVYNPTSAFLEHALDSDPQPRFREYVGMERYK